MPEKQRRPRSNADNNPVSKKARQPKAKGDSRYHRILAKIFADHYRKGDQSFEFNRTEIESVAQVLDIKLPKNIGDAIYSIRYRAEMPVSIAATAPTGSQWIIEPAGRGRYRFRLFKGDSRILPRRDAVTIKIPDATPEIIRANGQSDEQALLARVRYNRLVDIFLGVTAYSLQNHFRTTVAGMGQVELDEVYLGLNRQGQQFVIPVQAKGGTDQLSVVQSSQDIACCREKFPNLTCRPLSAQFLADNVIVLFELAEDNGIVKVAEERHYKLVPADEISPADLAKYAARTV